MKIIKTSKELTAPEIYNLTMNPQTRKMRDYVDSELEIGVWALYEDEQVDESTGELTTNKILSIMTPEGDEIVATNSDTFIRDFGRMWDLFTQLNSTVNAINVFTGKSKKGRDYVDCSWAR